MLFKIGTMRELENLSLSLPEQVLSKLTHDISVLDSIYGAERAWKEIGGYAAIIEKKEDLQQLKTIVDYEEHPCEWTSSIYTTKETRII